MSAILLLFGLALGAQLDASDERYPINNNALQYDEAPAAEDDANNGLIERFDPPPSDPAQPPAADDPAQPPARFEDAPPAHSPDVMKPAAMMRSFLAAPRGSQLSGDPVPLIDVLVTGPTRLEQAQRLDAYWELCASIADYYLGLREQEDLRSLRSVMPRVGPAWDEAEAQLARRIDAAQRAALASQLRLAAWLGRGATDLPLPADVPHCGDYHSRYDEIFINRPNAEAQQLAALLPLCYAELKEAAAAVVRAEEWLNAVATLRNEGSDGTGAVRALELLSLRRRAFVRSAFDYNRRIARYCELATPGEIGAERLLSMLIKSQHTTATVRSGSPTPPFGPPPINPPSHTGSAPGSPPPTFADDEGWTPAGAPRAHTRDNAVQPATGELERIAPRQERSLIVPRP